MFEWSDARYFLAIARAKSLSEAGRQLRVDQSTVGRRLRALEEALGVPLFDRTPDGYALTPAGERLVQHAERIEDEAFALEREASGREARLTGTVRITGPDALTARMVAPILCELHRRTPGIDFEVVAENRTLSLTKREADMAVRTFRPTEASIVARRVCGLGSALYASNAYLAKHGRPKGDDYGAHAFIGVDEPTWAEAKWLRRAAPNARVVLKTASTPTQLTATLEGIAIGILPCYIADAEPGLVRLSADPVIMREVWIAFHRDLQHATRIRACADLLAEGLTARAAQLEGVPRGRAPRPRPSRARVS